MKILKHIKMVAKSLLFVSLLFLMSCQPSSQPTTLEHIQKDLCDGIDDDMRVERCAEPCMPSCVRSCMIPNLLTAVGKDVPGIAKRFDLHADQVPAKTFFLGIVQDTPYNVTVHPNVQGNISLDLKRVTIPEIFEAVRNVYGYEFKKSCNVIEILPVALQTRAFRVNYLNIKRKGTSDIQVSAGALPTNGGTTTTGSGNTATTTTNNGTGTTEIINSEIDTTSETDFWKELKDTVTTMVGDADGRKVATSPMSGLLVVKALPSELRKVDDFLKKARLTLNRQIILEAQILEVHLNDSYQAGINWAILSGRTRASQFGSDVVRKAMDPSPENPFPVVSNVLDPFTIPITPGKPPGPTFNSTQDVGNFGGLFTLAMNYENFGTFVELLGAQGKVHVLSNPRISTTNNQKAVIKVGLDQYFITNISSTTTAIGVTASSTPNVTFTPFFSGVALDVTPAIDDCNEVTLHIHPTITKVEDDTKRFILNGQEQSVPLALSSVRESDNVVHAKNGQMIIIGGLMQDFTRKTIEGIPILMNLPVIGALFRQTVEIRQKSELVILIRPVVPDDKTWTELVEDAKCRVDEYGGCVNDF